MRRSGPGIHLTRRDREFLQDVGEVDRRCVAGVNGNGLGFRAHITVRRRFRYSICARHQFQLNLSAGPGGYRLINAVSGDAEPDSGNNVIFRSLDDPAYTGGLGPDVHVRADRIVKTGTEGLFPYVPPDKHIVGNGHIFSELETDRRADHVSGELIGAAAAGNSDTAAAAQALKVDPQTVRIGQNRDKPRTQCRMPCGMTRKSHTADKGGVRCRWNEKRYRCFHQNYKTTRYSLPPSNSTRRRTLPDQIRIRRYRSNQVRPTMQKHWPAGPRLS